MPEIVELYLEYRKETESGLALILSDGDNTVCIAKSLLHCEKDFSVLSRGESYLFEVPRWLAENEGLV